MSSGSLTVVCPIRMCRRLPPSQHHVEVKHDLARLQRAVRAVYMTTAVTSWLKENYFLGGLVVAIFTMTAYVVKLETRVATLETRGSPHLAEINNRLTVLEKQTEANKASLDRVVEIMLRELPVKKEQLR
jgi:hypothetical protein